MTDPSNIDRQYVYKNYENPFERVDLHGFSDASQKACWFCVYLRLLLLLLIYLTSVAIYSNARVAC